MFLLVLIYYYKGFVAPDHMNSLDAFILRHLHKTTDLSTNASLKDILERLILAYSDQQAVTGPALFIAAFSQLSCPNGITAYHWGIVVYTVWFSSFTHLACLSALSDYFKERNKRTRPLRLALMGCTIALFIAALVPTIRPGFSTYPNIMVSCFYFQRMGSTPPGLDDWEWGTELTDIDLVEMVNIAFSISLLLFTFTRRVFDLYGFATQLKRLFDAASQKIKVKITAMNGKGIPRLVLGDLLLFQLNIARAALYIYQSFAVQVVPRFSVVELPGLHLSCR